MQCEFWSFPSIKVKSRKLNNCTDKVKSIDPVKLI